MKMAQKNAWNKYKKDEIKELESLCKDYREFLDNGKTERECVKEIVRQAEDHGYRDLKKIMRDFAVRSFIKLELFGVAEMLKNMTVFIGNCNFHTRNSSHICA